MKKINHYIILLLTLLLCHAATFAQQKIGQISGTVITAGKPVEGLTVSLLRSKDSVLTKAAVTDAKGQYSFEKIAIGTYFIRLSGIGYNTVQSDVVSISAEQSAVTFATLAVEKQSAELANVAIVSKKPFIENKIDKMVVNVDASPTNTGLTAMEVLEKSPGVTVDNDGNISVKGKQGVIILMDGKPTYLSGQDLANYLRNLSSNQLESIEIMTQPSAKYDAAGNSGVINIKTKKNKNNGFNGNISNTAMFANYYKNASNININWRKNKVNLFANYGFSSFIGFNELTIDRKFRKDENTNPNRYLEQTSFAKFRGLPHNFKVGADYFADKQTTIGVVVTGLIDNRQFRSEGNNLIYDSLRNQVQNNVSVSQTKDPWTNLGFNLNFRRVLDKKGSEITADADYVFYRTKGRQFSDNYLYNANGSLAEDPYLLRGYLPADIDIFTFKADYSKPLPGDAKLEAGIKASYVETDNDAQYTAWSATQNNWIKDGRSNHFIYKENINAAYLNVQKQIKKLGIQLGLRSEQTIAKGHQIVNNSKFKRDYTKLFPTAYFNYKANDNNTIVLSYGRRIERPGYQDLNPFQYILDRYTYREGNPYLQPQFSHNVELSYNYKGQLNISANYTTTTDIINDVLKTIKDGENFTTFQTKENIASRRNIGLAINYNKPIKKWWSLNMFGNVFNNDYDGMINNEKVDGNFISFTFNMNNQFTFDKGWTAEFSGIYNHTNLMSSVLVIRPMGMFSLGVGKQVLNKKGSIRINIRDPFWLQKFKGSTTMDSFVANIGSRWDNRRLNITFTYRFGKGNAQQQPRKRNSGAQEELNRVNAGGGQG